MIVSASYRTDIPAFYGRWFLHRLAEREAWVRNPYGGRPYRVSLAPEDVDGFVFWTRNLAPFAEGLAAVEARGNAYVVQYTITGMPAALEVGVPPAGHGVEQIARLASRRGRPAAVWRYDPILFTSLTPPDWHRRNFATLASRIAPYVDEVTVSFATIYRKTARNLIKAAADHDFSWREPEADEQRQFVRELAELAAEQGLKLTLCSQPHLEGPGVAGAACIDLQRLSRVADQEIHGRRKGNRPGCLCAESRDIGAYDTCAHGCVYCYAVSAKSKAERAVRHHRAEDRILGRLDAQSAEGV
jgi:hypothetical protein